MNTKFAVISIILLTLLTACNLVAPNPTSAQITPPTPPPTPLPFPTSPQSTPLVCPPCASPALINQAVIDRSFEVIQALKNQDMPALASFIHPVNGVRFSPYAFVEQADLVFSAEQIAAIMTDSQIYDWGEHSATGEPVNLSAMEYFARFVYDVDFANAPQMALNKRIGGGNSIDNSFEFYPGAMIVEYHFPGLDPQYEGMDWRSLRLVLSEYSAAWYLVGLIHDAWTP